MPNLLGTAKYPSSTADKGEGSIIGKGEEIRSRRLSMGVMAWGKGLSYSQSGRINLEGRVTVTFDGVRF